MAGSAHQTGGKVRAFVIKSSETMSELAEFWWEPAENGAAPRQAEGLIVMRRKSRAHP